MGEEYGRKKGKTLDQMEEVKKVKRRKKENTYHTAAMETCERPIMKREKKRDFRI